MLPLIMAAAGVSVFGKLQEGVFARQQGRVIRKELRLQADTLLQNRALDVKFTAEAQKARRGTQQLQFARGGVDVNSGSAFEHLLAQSRYDSISRTRMMYEAQLQARQLRFQGAQAKQSGDQALFQSVLSSFGSVANAAAVGMGGSTFQRTTPTAPSTVPPGGWA